MKPYLTREEIIEDIIKKLSTKDINYLKSIEFHSLIRFHFSVGMDIRNRYNLWDPSYPYLNGEHPDDVSYKILQQVWLRVNEQ
jgi:hypothetical protein